jgi:hypothetical protein
LRIAPDWCAVARITVRTQCSDRVDYGNPCECNVPGQQATPGYVIDYQYGADRDPGQDRDYLPAADIAFQLVSNIAPKPGIQTQRRKADAKSTMKARYQKTHRHQNEETNQDKHRYQ